MQQVPQIEMCWFSNGLEGEMREREEEVRCDCSREDSLTGNGPDDEMSDTHSGKETRRAGSDVTRSGG